MTRLRQLEPEDARFYAEIQNDRDVRAHIGKPLNVGEDECRQAIEAGHGALESLFVIETDDGEPIGICGFTENNHFDGTDTLIQLATPYQNRGVGSEVLAILTGRWLSEERDGDLYATVSPWNEVAIHLLLNAGFRYDSEFTDLRGMQIHKYRFDLDT